MEPSNSSSNSSQDNTSFPGTSFTQAINQLGLQSMPTQTPYPPLVPSSSPVASSSASPLAAHGGTATAAVQLQVPAGLSQAISITNSIAAASSSTPPHPLSSASSVSPTTNASPRPQLPSSKEIFGAFVQRIYRQVLSEWSPRQMSPEEVQEHQLATQRRIELIHALEAAQARMRPSVDIGLEQTLFAERVKYQARLPRTFRINDLPTEIFINIVHLVCWSTSDNRTGTQARQAITATCRQWRTLAIADTTLWNVIRFSDYPKYERSFEWLERSGNAAIDLRISDDKERPWTIPLAQQVIGRLFTKLSSIRVLVIVLEDWDPLFYILDALRIVKEQNLPMIMERLEMHRTGPAYIQVGTAYPPEFYTRSIPLFGGADVRTFNYLTVNAVYFDWMHSSLRGLQTLDMRRVSLERVPSLRNFRQILADSPDLRKLVLDSAGPMWASNTLASTPIELPMLRSLALGNFSSAYATYTASQFTCANVIDLTVMNAIREDFSPFWRILTGRLPSLRSLSLYGADLVNDSPLVRMTFLKWLQSIPKLSFLRVNAVTPVIMDLFLYDMKRMQLAARGSGRHLTDAEPTSHPVCPELTVLELHTMDTDYMARWIVARDEMGYPLHKIYVIDHVSKVMSEEEKEKLRSAFTSGRIQILKSNKRPIEELQLVGEDA